MRKSRLSVYLEPQVMAALTAYAERRDRSLSMVAEAAIAEYLTPDNDVPAADALTRRLDRVSRQLDRGERDITVLLETLALLVRNWLTLTPAVPEAGREAAKARGDARYQAFVTALGRRLAKDRRFIAEVSIAPTEPAASHGADGA